MVSTQSSSGKISAYPAGLALKSPQEVKSWLPFIEPLGPRFCTSLEYVVRLHAKGLRRVVSFRYNLVGKLLKCVVCSPSYIRKA